MNTHIKALDGIRGLAILMVLMHHFGDDMFIPSGPIERAISHMLHFGWCGVDLFFCLSGFLITGILLRTVGSPNYFRQFYVRRVLRIFPAYYLYVAAIVLSVIVAHRFGNFRHNTSGQFWVWFYLANWHDTALPHSGHLWSLAVEEQFYLMWPLAIAAFRNRALSFCLSVAALSFLARLVAVYMFGWGGRVIVMGTPFRMDGLALGGAAACIAASPQILSRVKAIIPWLLCISLTAAVAIATAFGSGTGTQMETFGFAALALSFSSLVLHCATSASSLSKAFLFPPLRHLGKFSYGIYLFHFVLVRPPSTGLIRALLFIVFGAFGSYLLVPRPHE